MTVFGSICTGGALADLGAKQAGYELAWGIELDPHIAEVANVNLGDHVVTGNVTQTNMRRFEPVDTLHASPPCPNFSAAKVGGAETETDLAIARKIAEAITLMLPRVFTLENVPPYQRSKSWAIIQEALYANGYWLHVAVLNAADFGVPQTRRRMVVRAVRNGVVPHLPPKTPWRGWLEAIADLIPNLPESEFAPWQLERLPKHLSAMLVSGGGSHFDNDEKQVAQFKPDEPAMTVLTGSAGRVRAFVEGSFLHMTGATSQYPETRGTGVLEPDTPANTVTPSSGKARAFIVHATDFRSMPVRLDDEPTFTCMAGVGSALNMPRAYLVDSANANSSTNEPTVRRSDEPTFTITATGNRVNHRALFEGKRIVKMTPRALARFQGVPDSYKLPEKKALACRIIGNGCPPPMFEALYEGLA